MGDCIYCSKPAGFLRKRHEACQQAHDIGKSQILSLYKSSALGERPFENLSEEVKSISDTNFISSQDCRELMVAAWSSAVEKAFEDGILTKEEAKCFTRNLAIFQNER